MDRLIWLSKSPGPAREKALLGALSGAGFQCVRVTTSVERWDKTIGEAPYAWLLCGDDSAWLEETLKQARAASLGTPIPAIWLQDGIDEAQLGAEVDDTFPLDGRVEELIFRIRHRKRLREKHAERDRQILELARNETALRQREEFLGVCAHDLRSPLGLIQSSLSMVLNAEPGAVSAFHRELLARAKRQATQAIALVNDLLDVTSYEQGLKPQYRLLKLNSFLEEFHGDCRFQAEQKQIHFHYENAVASWRVLADADRLRQLLQNLFTNALKFTAAGKRISLSVTPFQGRRKTDPPYPMLILSLKDEGKGIPRAEVEKIFDRFSQIRDHSRAEGRGLGLTVAKQISTLHDGNIWVQSVEGEGSTFFVLLPHVISRQSAQERPSGKRALVAEPSVHRRELFRPLEECGYELLFARDGVETVTLMFHHLPDLLVLTPGLAKLDEAEVANILKADPVTSSRPVLLALEEGRKSKKKPEEMLIDQVLPLPFSKETFRSTLKDLGGRQAGGSASRKAA